LGINYDIHNDSLAYKEYLDWLKKVWLETKRVLVPGGRFALNIAPTSIKNFRPIHHDFSNQMRKIGLIMRTEIIWYKQTMGRRTAWGSWKSPANPHIVPSWEYVLIFSKKSWNLNSDSKETDITADEFIRFSDGFWYIPPESQRRGHPTPFPEELIYRLIKFYTYKDNIVLDMFGGTGTVAVVALKTGRHFINIDVSPKYCEIAEDRLQAARLLREFPLSVGKPGRKVKIGRYISSKTTNPTQGGKKKEIEQSRLLESRGKYKPKKTKHA
jgi:site-specific DNA-methyltransferase (adenine-specific)